MPFIFKNVVGLAIYERLAGFLVELSEAEVDAKLGKAVRVFKSEENGHTVCFYAPKGLIPKTYPAYSVLWYHRRLKVCTDNAMLGVIAGFTTDKLNEIDEGSAGAPSSQTASGRR